MKPWPAETWVERVEVLPVDRTPEARMGEMLWSAIRRGALLDRRWWPSWVRGVQIAADFQAGQVSVDMEPDAGTPTQARRWFADPVTQLLIAQWHRDRLRLRASTSPEDCLRAFLPHRADVGENLAQTALEAGRAVWRLRLPGVLHAYAAGDVPSVSVPKTTWRRITRGLPMPDAPSPYRPRTSRRLGMDAERRILTAHQQAGNLTGRADDRARKAAAAAALQRLPPATYPRDACLRRWCIFALKHECGRSSAGLAPSTAKGHLIRLLAVFDGWRDRDPCEVASGKLVDLFISTLETAANKNLNKTIDAMESFARFYNLARDDGDELEYSLDDYRCEQPVSANLIPPAAYRRALAQLSGGTDRDSALILVLAFRTGARLPEITGLQVGDFVEGRGRLELVIQENEGRVLKTKTSRRIVPLDVLLDDAERACLAARLAKRRAIGRTIGDTFLFGPPGAVAPPPDKPFGDKIEAALRKACGSDRISFAHLRHSFATYLLATLLLPQDVPEPSIPEELASVVSRQRFSRVVDRLLGKGRLGGGAVHAVSQLMGHTGPATTLRSYCHLLDLCLGLYVSRPSSLLPIREEWLRERLDVTPDARRKAIARSPQVPAQAAHHRLGRPSRNALLRHTPDLTRKLVDAKLLETGSARAARGVRRAQAAKVDDAAFGNPYKACAEIERTPRSRDRQNGPEPYIVPWLLMAESIDKGPGPSVAGVERKQTERWRAGATRLGASSILGVDASDGGSFSTAIPTERALRLLIDRRLSLPRALHRHEQTALLAATRWLRRDSSHVRLKRLSDARAFVDILTLMGFKDEEVGLTVTNLAGHQLSSEELHAFLRGSDVRHPLSGRQGWRGSLVVRVRPGEVNGPRRGWQAVRFALVMLAIDAGR